MEEKMKLRPEDFQALEVKEELDAEKIAAPSLTFTQDAWRRLKKNKGAVISALYHFIYDRCSVWFDTIC